MISWLSKHRKAIFIATVAFFLIGTFVGLGSYLFTSRDASGAVAEVGGVKIPYAMYQLRYRQALENMRERGAEVTEAMEKQVGQDIQRDLIVEEIFAQKAADMGFGVSDLELLSDVQRTFQRGGSFDQRAYYQTVVTQFRMSPEQYEAMRRRTLLSYKYRQFIANAVKVPPKEVEAAYVKEKGSLKDFEAERPRMEARLHQERSLAALNYLLRQLSTQVEIKDFLAARQKGM